MIVLFVCPPKILQQARASLPKGLLYLSMATNQPCFGLWPHTAATMSNHSTGQARVKVRFTYTHSLTISISSQFKMNWYSRACFWLYHPAYLKRSFQLYTASILELIVAFVELVKACTGLECRQSCESTSPSVIFALHTELIKPKNYLYINATWSGSSTLVKGRCWLVWAQ